VAGVRGYEESSFAGAQRLVARTEERWSFPNVRRFADAGVAVFADVGRQWAGDAPFGVTTPVLSSVGFSLLAAVPPRSARLWRADVAFPLGPGAGSRWTLRFTNGDRTTFEFRTPTDVADRRALTVPTSLFAWP
jgi:hemolysin activation/secretion protein